MYVKFSCNDTESLQHAGSYTINSFFDKLIEADCFGEHENKFYSERNLYNESVIMNKVEKYQDEAIGKNESRYIAGSV